MSERRRVVITGLGAINSLGHNVAETWAAARDGRSGIAPIASLADSDVLTKFGGEVKEFDPVAHFGRREARRMDRVAQLAAVAANEAIADARLQITAANRERIGVVIGSGIGGVASLAENMATLAEKGANRVSPFMAPMMLIDTAAGLIAIHHDLRGPNMAVVTACASSNNALGEAARMIRQGVVDVVVSGGAEACLIPIIYAGFNAMGALSTRNDDPQRGSRPFDLNRDGFVPAEGSAILILEDWEHAQARGAKIYAEFLGYGASADAYHISAPAENGEGAVLSMKLALAEAGLTTADISWISAHGTGTSLNDKSETAAIKTVFGEQAYNIPVSSTKSMHGHLMGGAGALEAVIAVQAMQANFMPPTINYETPDPDCDLDYVPNVGRAADMDAIMSNSFGFGGHNATIVLGKV
jgi:3-oxoacyl-[acyl-carrier-protein] synthase II